MTVWIAYAAAFASGIMLARGWKLAGPACSCRKGGWNPECARHGRST